MMNSILSICLVFFLCESTAQKNPIYLDGDTEARLERWELLFPGQSNTNFPSFPSYRERFTDSYQHLDTVIAQIGIERELLTNTAMRNNDFVTAAPSTKPILNHFFKTPAQFYELDKQDFYLRINPILNLKYSSSNQANQSLWKNQRGIEIRGGIDKKLFFYTRVFETQQSMPSYVDREISEGQSIPGQGFYKVYRSDLLGITRGFDYLNGDGGISYCLSKHIDLSLGHGRHFIGSGMRSLLLSDFADNYFYLRLNTQVWKLRYQNIYAELSPSSSLITGGNGLLPKKYMTAHYLGIQVSPSVYIGLFESVVFSRNNQFELQYLNPIILYRTIEQKIGSPDNVLLGLDARIDFLPRTRWYGQFLLDELVLGEFFGGRDWWGNKFAFQLGVKHFDLLNVPQLNVRLEYNRVRPFTYSHRDSSANYSHSNQALAHPLGANFDEVIFQIDYRPTSKFYFEGQFSSAKLGRDPQNSDNLGQDILKPNGTRTGGDFGHQLGQGLSDQLLWVRLKAWYEWKPGLYLETVYQSRRTSVYSSETNWSIGIRWNAKSDNFRF